MDKINRLEKPIATEGEIKYGKGSVFFETNGEVAAFEINYRGVVKGVKKLGEGWTAKIGENKIIIFSMAKSELSELLFTYVGELEITSCKFVTWNENLFHAKVNNLNQNKWTNNYGQWQSDARKPEEIKTQLVIGRKVKKSSI